MVTVTVLVFDYALASAVTGINDLLYLATRVQRQPETQSKETNFKVQIASWDGKPVKALNNMEIMPHCAIQSVKYSDVYLVPMISGDIERTLDQNPELVQILREAGESNCLIGSNSSGSFFLAEAGLLDNKVATTHWSFVDLFRQKYPLVDLKPEQQITHDGNILCDAGGLSWFDLGLYLVELFCGHESAVNIARSFVIDVGRSAQLSYSPLISKKYHNDKTILAIQNWMEDNYQTAVVIEQLGQQFGLSNRSLIRRFKNVTGSTPSSYLQDVRVDFASKYLVQTNKTIEEITHAVGYEDMSSFTRLFKRKIGLSPSNYRALRSMR